MRIYTQDVYWLESAFPSLIYDSTNSKIIGELDFCATYNAKTKTLYVEGFNCEYDSLRKTDMRLCDVFEIEIRLNEKSIVSENWPKVYEVGGRREDISKRQNILLVDLHFYTQDNSCCLGISYAPVKVSNIKEFLYHIVIPFFYRLSYVDRFGLQATKEELWGEYSHGEGELEYFTEMSILNRNNDGRNKPCPCGSKKKYKKCHLDEVREAKLKLEYLLNNQILRA